MLRRRTSWGLGLGLVLVTGILAAIAPPATPALADPVVMAVEDTEQDTGGEVPAEQEQQELPGPEPDPQTTFAPSDYERNWTWWIGVILTAVTAIAIAGIGISYYVLVDREREEGP